ncbi:hypothetical protein ACMXDT_001611, partial [Campylobacter jejuni]
KCIFNILFAIILRNQIRILDLNIATFEKKLNELNLTKKEFAKMVGAVYNSVINWNVKGETPKWVDSWICNYEKARSFDIMKSHLQSL